MASPFIFQKGCIMRKVTKNDIKDVAISITSLATGIGAEYAVYELMNVFKPSKFKGLYWLGGFGIMWMVGMKVTEFTQNSLEELTE